MEVGGRLRHPLLWNLLIGLLERLILMRRSTNRRESVSHLRDGRDLGHAEYGDPCGHPVFIFHGSPGSRLQRPPDASIASELGVRLITIDRPGYGLSDFQPHRTLLDWPCDVAELADALHLDRFGVIGLSGGGPYVLACAYSMPERLTSAIVISGMGPLDQLDALGGVMPSIRLGLGIVRHAPWMARLALELAARILRINPVAVKKLLPVSMPTVDKETFAQPDIQVIDQQDLSEAYRHGGGAFFWELVLFTRPWGFRLADIHTKIHLWHGEEDTTVPASLARNVAHALPNCEPRFYPVEGHTLVYHYWREILELSRS
jgi:pimeloyl-ACP methyl ester carboxylesterase